MKLSARIVSCVNLDAIEELRKHKFDTFLNEVDSEPCNDVLNARLRNCPASDVEDFTPEKVCVFASSLVNNKCPKVVSVQN